MDGVLVVDKPAGLTSAQVVETVKRRFGAQRAGHAGTLDPIATGVLPILLDEATKLAAYLIAEDKEYEVEVVLGVETDTLDRVGTVTATRAVDVTEQAVAAALARRIGEHDQVPPMYSAIKQGGVRLHERARAGEDVPRAPRRVRIDRLELLSFAPPRLALAIACSKGTYVRSLVADLGRELGCGAHVAELRRTRAGAFAIADAQPLDALDPERLIGMSAALRMPVVAVPPALVAHVRSGVQLEVDKLDSVPSQRFQMVGEGRVLLAIAHEERGRVVYDRVFKACLPA
jgi:tRNA pseudouridine55 synthase